MDIEQRVGGIDLGVIKNCLKIKYGWSDERFEEAEGAYRKFLAVVGSAEVVRPYVPSADVDEIWHQHILHTKKYTADCEAAFGRYVHHFPNTNPMADKCCQPCDANGCYGNRCNADYERP